MADNQESSDECDGDHASAAEDSAADENRRIVCCLKYITALTDLSHVPAFASQDRLPEEAVSALDAVMEDYRCNGPTVPAQQVPLGSQPPIFSCGIALQDFIKLKQGCHTVALPQHCFCSCP